MRNLLPISLFAAAASLTILATPTLHADRFAVRSDRLGISNAVDRPGAQEDARLGEREALRFFVPRCDRQNPCTIRRPMT